MPNSAFKSKTFRLLLAWFNIVFYTPIFGAQNFRFRNVFVFFQFSGAFLDLRFLVCA